MFDSAVVGSVVVEDVRARVKERAEPEAVAALSCRGREVGGGF